MIQVYACTCIRHPCIGIMHWQMTNIKAIDASVLPVAVVYTVTNTKAIDASVLPVLGSKWPSISLVLETYVA